MVFNRGGSSAGVARGEFRIGTSQVRQARQDVEANSRAMGNSFRDLGRNAQVGTRQVNDSLRQMQQQAQQSRQMLEGIFSGAFLARGVQTAQHIRQINASIELFSGSQAEVNKNMEILEGLAKRTNAPIIRLKEAAAGLLPTAKAFNADLEKTLLLAQRLAVLNPAAGIEGARFSLGEFFSGETISIVDRFNLSRKELNRIKEESEGDVSALIDGLDELLARMGITEEVLIKQRELGLTAYEDIGAAVQEAIGNSFTPLNDVVVAGAQAFLQINAQQPGLLQTVTTIAAITAGLVAMRFAAQQASTALKGLGGSLAGRALGLGASIGLGAQAGIIGAQALADRTNLQSGDLNRIRGGEDPSAILSERLNQGIVIFLDVIRQAAQSFVSIGGVIALGVQVVSNAITNIGAALSLGANVIKEGFGSIQEGIGTFLINFASAFSGVFDTTAIGQSGLANIDLGSRNRLEARAQIERDQTQLNQGIGVTPEQAARIATNLNTLSEGIDNAFRGVQQSVVSFLFPAIQQQAEAAEGPVNPLKGFTDAMRAASGSLEETRKKIDELNAEYEKETRRIGDARSLADSRQQFDDALASARQTRNFNQGLAQSDADFFRNRAQQIERFNQGLLESEREAQIQRTKQLENFRREDVRRAEDFGRRLAQIEEETRLSVLDAASRLDARAVFNAQQRGTQQVNEATKNFEIENQRREQDFQIQLQQLDENLASQRNQRLAAFNQQLSDQQFEYNLQRQRRIDAFNQQRADEAQDRQIRLARLIEDREIEDRLRQEALQDKIQDLTAAFIRENKLNQAFANSIANLNSGFRTNTVGTLSNIAAYALQVKNQVSALLNQATNPYSGSYYGGGGGGAFAFGGNPPIGIPVTVNDQGRGTESALMGGKLALFGAPATIFSARETRQLLAGGAGGPSVQIGSLVLGDIGDRSDSDVVALIERAFMEMFNRG